MYDSTESDMEVTWIYILSIIRANMALGWCQVLANIYEYRSMRRTSSIHVFLVDLQAVYSVPGYSTKVRAECEIKKREASIGPFILKTSTVLYEVRCTSRNEVSEFDLFTWNKIWGFELY